MKQTRLLLASALLFAASPMFASTSFVVDFGSGTQSSTSTVNNISTINITSGITVGYDGSSLSGISLTTSGFAASLAPTNPWTGGTVGWMTDAIGCDYFRAGSTTEGYANSSTGHYVATVTITGLSAGYYTVQLCSDSLQKLTSNYSIEDIKVAGSGSATYATSNSAGTTGTGNDSTSWNAGTTGCSAYLIWDKIYTSTGSLTITITDESTVSNNIFLNGLYVATAVPEPSQTAGVLGALAVAGAVLRRRFKKA